MQGWFARTLLTAFVIKSNLSSAIPCSRNLVLKYALVASTPTFSTISSTRDWTATFSSTVNPNSLRPTIISCDDNGENAFSASNVASSFSGACPK